MIVQSKQEKTAADSMARLKAHIQATPRPRVKLVSPCASPRYDDVYHAGVRMLNNS